MIGRFVVVGFVVVFVVDGCDVVVGNVVIFVVVIILVVLLVLGR